MESQPISSLDEVWGNLLFQAEHRDCYELQGPVRLLFPSARTQFKQGGKMHKNEVCSKYLDCLEIPCLASSWLPKGSRCCQIHLVVFNRT